MTTNDTEELRQEIRRLKANITPWKPRVALAISAVIAASTFVVLSYCEILKVRPSTWLDLAYLGLMLSFWFATVAIGIWHTRSF